VHQIGILLHNIRKSWEILLKEGFPAEIQPASGIRDPGFLDGTGRSQLVTLRRAHLFMLTADQDNIIDQVPVVRGCDRMSIRGIMICSRLPFNKATGNGAAG
jgi:hypothetical protein